MFILADCLYAENSILGCLLVKSMLKLGPTNYIVTSNLSWLEWVCENHQFNENNIYKPIINGQIYPVPNISVVL